MATINRGRFELQEEGGKEGGREGERIQESGIGNESFDQLNSAD